MVVTLKDLIDVVPRLRSDGFLSIRSFVGELVPTGYISSGMQVWNIDHVLSGTLVSSSGTPIALQYEADRVVGARVHIAARNILSTHE